MVELEKNHDYQLEHWDFIQQHIRKFCLKCQYYILPYITIQLRFLFKFLCYSTTSPKIHHSKLIFNNIVILYAPCTNNPIPIPSPPVGASLIYTSVKEDKNCGLLFKYLSHLVYNFPFTEQPCVVEKDSVFMSVFFNLIFFLSFYFFPVS